MKPLVLHIHKSHFTVNGNENTIKLDALNLIDCLNKLEIPPSIPFDEQNFENGFLVVQVIDHRYNTDIILRLKPTNASIKSDIKRFVENYGDCGDDNELEIEAKILPHVFKLDLDVSNSGLLQSKLIKNYNATKFRKRSHSETQTIEKEGDNEVSYNDLKLMLLLSDTKAHAFYPRFGLHQYVTEWRQKKSIADHEVLIGLGDKNKIRLNAHGTGTNTRRMLVYNENRRILRTLRFESKAEKNTTSMLNVYEIGDGEYEGVLRWGNGAEGTAINGNTLRYSIGNKTAVEYYIQHFKGLYGVSHDLKSDVAVSMQQ